MSAEDIIAKHRQRLEEHKKFLSHKKSSKSNPGDLSARSGASSSTHHTAGGGSSHDDPTSAREYTDRHRQSRRFQTVPEDGASGGAGGPYEAQDTSLEYEPESPSNNNNNDNNYNNEHSAARSTSRLIDGEGIGIYYTDDPHRVFEDNYRWQQKKERAIADQKRERANGELDGCTFKPNTHNSQRRCREVLSQEREPLYASNDQAITNHVLRQRQGREDKVTNSVKAQGGIDIRNWENRTTQVKEFNLGGKNYEKIGALKKPISWKPGQGSSPPSSSRAAASQQRPQNSSRGDGQRQQSRGAHGGNNHQQQQGSSQQSLSDEQKARIQLFRQRQASSSQERGTMDDHYDEQDDYRSGSGGNGSSQQQLPMPPLEVVEAMDKTISSQEIEIARLKGIIQAQRRELDVAKSKVRQMALANQVAAENL